MIFFLCYVKIALGLSLSIELGIENDRGGMDLCFKIIGK